MFPTHPPLFSLHILGLACFSIIHDNSLMILLIREVLDWFGKCFSPLWGFIIFGKSDLWASMICLPPTQFSFIRMYYYCNNQSIHLINNTWKYIVSLLLYSVSSFFSLFSLCILVRIILVEISTYRAYSSHQGYFSNGIRATISTWN